MNGAVRALLVAGAAALVFLLPGLLGGRTPGAFTVLAIFAVIAYGLDLVLSDLGEVSLAHTVFFAAGAYATGLLATRADWEGWGTLAGAVVASLALAALLGAITLRLREFVFSLVTYAASVVAAEVAHNWSFVGGSDDITGIPPVELAFSSWRLTAGNDAALWPVAFMLLLAWR